MTTPATNDDQKTYWNSDAGGAWVAQQAALDRQLAPLGRAAMAALAPRAGERILDIGCGAGTTTRALADVVGLDRVTGVDVSAPLLAHARARHPGIAFVEADAQTHAFPPGGADAIFSRFGVMFFADPEAAFRNLCGALRPGGRLAFVCWRRVEDNPIMTAPLYAAVQAGVPRPPTPADPHAPGPFAFADVARVGALLARAGFTQIASTPHDERVGDNSPEVALELALEVGPLGRLIRETPEHRERALAAVRAALARFLDGDVVRMPSATWIVTAARPV